jgi:hypothetical protein
MESILLIVALVASVSAFAFVMRSPGAQVLESRPSAMLLDSAQLVRTLPKDPRPPRVLPAVIVSSRQDDEIERLTEELRRANERIDALTAANASRIAETAERFHREFQERKAVRDLDDTLAAAHGDYEATEPEGRWFKAVDPQSARTSTVSIRRNVAI